MCSWLVFMCGYVLICSHVRTIVIFHFLSLCVSLLSTSFIHSFPCLSMLACLVNLRWFSWIFRLTWLTSGVWSVGNNYFTLDGYSRELIHASACVWGLYTTCPVLPQFIALHITAVTCTPTHTEKHTQTCYFNEIALSLLCA